MASNPITRMTVAGLICFAVVSAAAGADGWSAAFVGMAGPLAATIGSWLVLDRVHTRTPDQVSGVMVKLFGAKLVLFGAYVTAAMLLLSSSRITFIVSFVTHYILLHLTEAVYLRRLFTVADAGGQRLGVS
jgi:hypothetical protein